MSLESYEKDILRMEEKAYGHQILDTKEMLDVILEDKEVCRKDLAEIIEMALDTDLDEAIASFYRDNY